jgi:hypothetical protein
MKCGRLRRCMKPLGVILIKSLSVARARVCARETKKTQHIAAVFEFHQPQEPIS